MNQNCPVCNSLYTNVTDYPGSRSVTIFSCPRCGDFIMTHTLLAGLPHKIEQEKDGAAKLSHALRTMQGANEQVEVNTSTITELLKRPLPSPKEQADLLVRALADMSPGPGEGVNVSIISHGSIVGAKSTSGLFLIIDHLDHNELAIVGNVPTTSGVSTRAVTLTVKGWEYYDQLKQTGATYHKAFMAMKFGEAELDKVFKDVFKPCVEQAGFELNNLADAPRAGLIDDRLRVEIQGSDFLIADLTHRNNGAYWEAGYAEGLGKPVIYTCEKTVFEEDKTHFDTNHHLTVIWDKDAPEQAGEELKATIRATLPALAKQQDD